MRMRPMNWCRNSFTFEQSTVVREREREGRQWWKGAWQQLRAADDINSRALITVQFQFSCRRPQSKTNEIAKRRRGRNRIRRRWQKKQRRRKKSQRDGGGGRGRVVELGLGRKWINYFSKLNIWNGKVNIKKRIMRVKAAPYGGSGER